MGSLRGTRISEERANKDSFWAGHKMPNLAWYRPVAARGERPRADSEGKQEGVGVDGQFAAGEH